MTLLRLVMYKAALIQKKKENPLAAEGRRNRVSVLGEALPVRNRQEEAVTVTEREF